MPRPIISQDPIVQPASPEVTYDKMEVASFRIFRSPEGDHQLRAQLVPVDSNGDMLRGKGTYSINLKDLDNQMAVTPKFAAAWDTIVDCMGLAYDFYRLREKVDRAIADGKDATELIAERNAALAALRAPV